MKNQSVIELYDEYENACNNEYLLDEIFWEADAGFENGLATSEYHKFNALADLYFSILNVRGLLK